ncbi:MAG: hypothetical protein JXA68_06775 [Ignavibacteriales bacterium]|nr:hypothetical protein [Ignavibacteriales bacterium]
MKKLLLPIFTFILFNCSGGLELSSDGAPEKQFVSAFLDIMIEEERDYDKMMEFLSPSFIEENSVSNFKVNSYFPTGYSIDSYSDGVTKAQIWGEEKSWVHLLTFKVVIENEKYYLYPGGASDEWIDPWFEVETYINE